MLDVLARAGAELYARSHRIRAYLDQVEPYELRENQQVVETIRVAASKIEHETSRTFERVVASPDKHEDRATVVL